MAYLPMELIETSVFSRRIDELLDAESYRALQLYLDGRPGAGLVVPGLGGIRKLRWSLPGSGRRGGLRVLYYWHVARSRLLLLMVYRKNERADLTSRQAAALRNLILKELR